MNVQSYSTVHPVREHPEVDTLNVLVIGVSPTTTERGLKFVIVQPAACAGVATATLLAVSAETSSAFIQFRRTVCPRSRPDGRLKCPERRER